MATKKKAPRKWIQAAAEKMEKKGTKGALHEDLGVPKGKKIPPGKLAAAAKKPGIVGKRARFALNVKKKK